MEILGENEIGYKEVIKVDNNGHLIISEKTGGGSSSGSAIIPPTTTTGNIAGVGVFGKTSGANTYSPLNVDATGHLLVSSSGDDNIVLIQGNDGAQNRNVLTDGTGQIATTNANISKGQDVKAVGEGLQQVLVYGRKADGTLQPVETSGDRLLVDVVELAASGRITTSTALSSVQVCGYDTGTNQFKTLNVDGTGKLAGGGSETYTNTSYLSSITLNSKATTSTIDLGTASCKELRVFFTADSEFVNFYGVGSNDDTDYYALFPTNGNPTDLMYAFSTDTNSHPTTNGAYSGTYKAYVQYVFAHPPRYVLFRNHDVAAITGLSASYTITRD